MQLASCKIKFDVGTSCPQLGHVDSSCIAMSVFVFVVSADDACDVVLADVLVLDTLSELFLDFFRLEDGMLDIVDFLLSWCIQILQMIYTLSFVGCL